MVSRQMPLVYIVDDDEEVRASTQAVLKAAGTNVRGYASGQDFLENFDSSVGGCVILDLHMPGQSGFQVLDELRAQGSAVPVILFSGRMDLALEEFAKRSGAVSVLTKPAAHGELIAQVRRLLDESGQPHAKS